VGIDREPLGGPQRVLDHRVLPDGHHEAAGELDRIEQLARGSEHGVRRRVGWLARERCFGAAPAGTERPVARLAPGDEDDVGAPRGDVSGRTPEERRLQHADLRHLRARPRGTEPRGHDAAGIGIVPEPARDADRVRGGEQRARPRIGRGPLEALDHELDRLARPGGVVLALGHRADADEDRRAGRDAAHRVAPGSCLSVAIVRK
jgi:hypothetical protein